MNILITGHKGFIGQNMVHALQGPHHLRLYEWGDRHPSLEGLDWVIHLGALTSTTETNVERVLCHNLEYSQWLLGECVKHGVNLQWASSASVYGLGQDFRESAPVDPRTPYAWSKYLFERHITQQGSLPILVQGFRYFNVYGPHEDHKGDQASPHHRFGLQAREQGFIEVFRGSENYVRDFVPVSQVIRTHQQFWRVPLSGVWNVGTGNPQSFRAVAEQYGVPIVEIPMPGHLRNSYQEYTCADMTLTHRTLASSDK